MNELESVTNVISGNNWKSSLKDTLALYLGTDSSITQRVDTLYFTKKKTQTSNVRGVMPNTVNVYTDSNKENFRNLIQRAIFHIDDNGVYIDPKKRNFLSSFTNKEVIGGIVTTTLIVFSIGGYFGRLDREREIINFESKIEKMEEEKQNNIQTITTLRNELRKMTEVSTDTTTAENEIKTAANRVDGPDS